MIDRCDRCGRIAETSEVIRGFNGKIPIELCKRCLTEWSALWLKTYGQESFAVRSGEKTLPIETEDLWEMFMNEELKEIVCFS